MTWPDWWEWELEISSHCLKRMQERGFNEANLRSMFADAMNIMEQDHGTFLISTNLEKRPWELIVEPDMDRKCIVVVTAYSTS